jgi:hypothetical protein
MSWCGWMAGREDRRFWGFLDYWPLRWREAVHLWDQVEVLTWGECQQYSRGVRLYANLMGKVEAMYSIGGYWIFWGILGVPGEVL